MKLVTFEDPIWATLQGEGILIGTPSVFIRTYGCDYSCAWCDTKGSWKPGTSGAEYALDDIVNKARSFRLRHAVVTGGNPVLQEQLPELIVALQSEYYDLEEPLPEGLDRGINEDRRLGMHVTVETQASIFDEAVARHADLMSISPKLHDWRGEVVEAYIDAALMRDKAIQVKVVTLNEADVDRALGEIEWLFVHAARYVQAPEKLHFIIQPESSLGRPGVAMVRSRLERWHADFTAGAVPPVVRVIPQTHKTSLFVR